LYGVNRERNASSTGGDPNGSFSNVINAALVIGAVKKTTAN
jgi:hypothetical protein